jgi:hypothetical protein
MNVICNQAKECINDECSCHKKHKREPSCFTQCKFIPEANCVAVLDSHKKG